MMRSFRQSMAWLHTWSGLLLGWALYVIFVTGTIAVFAEPLTVWMHGETRRPRAVEFSADERAAAVASAQRYLALTAGAAHEWTITLPTAAHPWTEVAWEDERHAVGGARLDPRSGAPAPGTLARDTAGAEHFVVLHRELHAGMIGFWIVGLAAVALLVAVFTGIVVHVRLLRDFFVFRPGTAHRNWLDGHNVTSVMTLPLVVLIAYTGVAIFYYAYMPAAIAMNYGLPGGISGTFSQEGPYFVALRATTSDREDVAASSTLAREAVPLYPLDELLPDAESLWGEPAETVTVDRPERANARVTLTPRMAGADLRRRLLPAGRPKVIVDGVTGTVVERVMPPAVPGAMAAANLMASLHMVTFGGLAMKWLYFVSSIGGCAAIASGLVLFSVKRHASVNGFGRRTPLVRAAIDVLNVATIAGLLVACGAYLWCNRLLPSDLQDRAAWEVRLFFVAWAVALVHAGSRPRLSAWSEQFTVAAGLALGLPILNAVTTDDHMLRAWGRGDWMTAGVEMTSIGLGAGFGAVCWVMRRHARGATEA